MRNIVKYGFTTLLLSVNISASAEVVHSLDQINPKMHSQDGKANFAKEMNGDTLPNEFGSDFWSTQTALKPSDIINIIAPQYKNDKWSLVGMKAWPGQKDRYIVVACSTKIKKEILDKYQENSCSYEVDPRDKIIVAVLDYDGSGMPKLAAEPYIETVASDENGYVNNDNGDELEKSAFNLKNRDDGVVVGNLQNLDFAHYQVNPQTLAFGIRYGAEVGYSGGNASNQSMTLFAIMQGKLRPILKTDMYHFANIAGEWHNDGTRDHDITEEEYILSFLPHQTNGFYDIKYTQKGTKSKKSKIYRWNNQKLYYQ
ncbi:unnamed protein product [Commensalibacter communis]|uniref:Uncharacterized protein n=1 Tax=Commensalibacter communis TaxID=2972786 RepID=A0A9W4X8U1_9PROT|nr:hypothetical protein [Commensalibacter communis]CAI3926590.1 unnamed protein product [Commensalibacter communis]CAI3928109.1 unnamed protein product [Commensalibacter communis]CAI3934384.1 unnamed protein product [Commensalibacter communis]CAI3934908.1 unnamed protein product [Commensalibacter communis]